MKRFTLVLIVTIAAALAVRTSCGEPLTEEVKALFTRYKTWNATTTEPVFVSDFQPCMPSGWSDPGIHAPRYVKFYVSPNALKSYSAIKTGQVVFPTDTVIVKEKMRKLDDAKASELAVMIKQESGDWEYLFVGKDGQQLVTTERLRNCVACHANAKNDSVYGYPAIRRDRDARQ